MDAADGGRQDQRQNRLVEGGRAWLGALALGAALSGGLAGGAAWFAGAEASAVLNERVERGLDAALDSLRLA